jgi:hypothetical protein
MYALSVNNAASPNDDGINVSTKFSWNIPGISLDNSLPELHASPRSAELRQLQLVAVCKPPVRDPTEQALGFNSTYKL